MAVGRHELNWRPWFPPICEKQLKLKWKQLQITRTTLTLRFKCRKLLVNLKSHRRDLFCSVSDFFDVCWYLVGFKASMSNTSCTSKLQRTYLHWIHLLWNTSTKGSSSRSCELDDWDEGQEHSPLQSHPAIAGAFGFRRRFSKRPWGRSQTNEAKECKWTAEAEKRREKVREINDKVRKQQGASRPAEVPEKSNI